MELTNSQKNIIAEFIYSDAADVLIKSDAERVIELFKEKKVEKAEEINLDVVSVREAIHKNISLEDRDSIMNDYYSGKL